MNKYDSQRIAEYLENKGYTPAKDAKQASLVVVNVCSVRQGAIDKVFNKVKSLCHPEGAVATEGSRGFQDRTGSFGQSPQDDFPKIILTGCILDSDKEKFEQLGVEVKQFPFLKGDKFRCDSRGFVPIMRGCNNFCSYCAVPYTRGREKYRPKEEIFNEIECLVKEGVKEITLLGQNVNSYPNFANLLKEINDLPGDFKVRFLTNHPKDMSSKLIKTIASCDKIVKEIHLPFQAGSNKILKKMNRGYTREQYLNLAEKIRRQIPQAKISTDIIVGFPKETKEDFQQTVDLMKKVNFDKAYIAMYSPRPGTAAAKLKDDVPQVEKKRRHHILLSLVK